MSVNKVILLGNVGGDPEIRYPAPDSPVAFFSLATGETRGGVKVTEWHNIVMTGRSAAYAEKFIRKGTKLYLEGSLRTREYTDRLHITRKRTEVFASTFEILGRSQEGATAQPNIPTSQQPT